MPKFGTSILSWIPSWTPEGGLYAIRKTAQNGFDLLEIILPPSLEFDPITVKRQLADHGIEGCCTLNMPANCHLPAHPDQAVRLIKAAIDKVAEMEGHFLGGVLHSAIGAFTGAPCTPNERLIVQQVFTEVAAYAGIYNITIAPEPINRYESYVFT
ncbi:MAG: sugar phosphate isomerase/epimerase, partial [Bacteroidota bacterium]|nr:sugar phosphate isomerase/epimerase [Bacteroidota bacterium]